MQGRPCRGFSFLSYPKWKETKERCKNVLSSEAESPIFVIIRRTRYAQTASHVDLLVSPLAIQESKKIPKIVHSLKTSSCGMFLKKTCSTKCGYELARFACRRMFLRIHSKKRQALSVVGEKTMACPAILKRRRKSSVSATFCLSPLPARSLIACYRRDARKIGEGFGEWFEVLLRIRRIRWLWPAASGCKYKLIVF